MFPINSWTVNLILGIIIAIFLGGGYMAWKHNVEQEIINEQKVQQLEQQIKDQEEYIKDIEALNKDSNEIISTMKNKEINLNTKLRDLESYLDNHKDDKESSEVLKRTIKELSQ